MSLEKIIGENNGKAKKKMADWIAKIKQDINLTMENDLSLINSNVSDCLVLLRIWLERRNLCRFAHILSLFALNLIESRKMSSSAPSFQMFKTVIKHLSSSCWDSQGLVVANSNNVQLQCQDYFDHSDVVVLDARTGLNLCHNITLDAYERLRFDAQLTLKIIDSNIESAFVFKTRINFYEYFDYIISLSPTCLKNKKQADRKQVTDNCCDSTRVLITQVLRLIKNAVGDRILLVEHQQENCPPSNMESSPIIFGILVNKEKALDIITKGPPADSPQASEFRSLWKSKSEIRRFQNGDICEAVLWDCDTQQDRRCIVLNAIKFILNSQLGLKLNTINSNFGLFENLLTLKAIEFDDKQVAYGTGEQFISLAQENANVLTKQVHSLGDLSFSIIEVIGTDSMSRSTEVFPMLPMKCKPHNMKYTCNQFNEDDVEDKIKHIKPYRLLVKVELDTKLATDLVSLQAQLHLLYAELSNALRKIHNYAVDYYSDHLDVFVNGFVFRLILTFTKQLSLYRHPIKATKDEIDEFEFQTEALPAISNCLRVYGQNDAAYSLTCRLFKRWLSIQMIKGFLDDITIDLLVAYVLFHHSTGLPPANSHLSGFIRVIKFVANFDFIGSPVILNFNNILSAQRIAEIRRNFINNRAQLPFLFVVSSYDKKLSYHSRHVSSLIVAHLQKLAASLHQQIVTNFKSTHFSELNNVVKQRMNKFDITIELDTKMIANKCQSIDLPASFKCKQSLYKEGEESVMPIVDYNPVRHYLALLRKSYDHCALFFHDEFGGRTIGVLLKPGADDQKPFKITALQCAKISAKTTALNVEALLEDFKILGTSLVSKVVLHTNKFSSK